MLSDDLNILDQAISHPRMSKERGDDVYGAYARLADAIHEVDALRARLAEVEAERNTLNELADNLADVILAKDKQLAEATPIIAAVATVLPVFWWQHPDAPTVRDIHEQARAYTAKYASDAPVLPPPSPEALDFLARAQSNPHFMEMMRRLADTERR